MLDRTRPSLQASLVRRATNSTGLDYASAPRSHARHSPVPVRAPERSKSGRSTFGGDSHRFSSHGGSRRRSRGSRKRVGSSGSTGSETPLASSTSIAVCQPERGMPGPTRTVAWSSSIQWRMRGAISGGPSVFSSERSVTTRDTTSCGPSADRMAQPRVPRLRSSSRSLHRLSRRGDRAGTPRRCEECRGTPHQLQSGTRHAGPPPAGETPPLWDWDGQSIGGTMPSGSSPS